MTHDGGRTATAGFDARRFGRRCAAVSLASALLLAAASDTPEAPPPAHTGGFGEPTCQVCHFDGEVNSGRGGVVLAGVPARYRPGGVYALTVTLSQPHLEVGGFQLSVRFADGSQAGTLAAAATQDARVEITPQNGVQYAHHTLAGIERVARDTVRWGLVWTAPAEGGAVHFHAAGNAGNRDASPFGDFVYTATAEAAAGK